MVHWTTVTTEPLKDVKVGDANSGDFAGILDELGPNSGPTDW